MPTKSKSQPKRQRCSRCKSHRLRKEWAPAAWGKPGKWCRSCRREHRQQKRAALKKKGA